MEPDSVSIELANLLKNEDPGGHRMARVFRDAFDQAYDGIRTGRYQPEQLSKTESAHIGSLVEINIRREFDGFINDGVLMDYRIAGHEVDCKYSKHPFGWMIPNETLGHHALVCHADDRKGTWRAGFVQVTDSILTAGGNRDQKRSIKAAGRTAIAWSWFDVLLPPNVLLQLPPEVADNIMSNKSGQQRINNLFRNALGKRIPRGTIETVAMQKDPMKRLRYNGGARSALQGEGIIILGDYQLHRNLADALNLPVPGAGDTVAARLTPTIKNVSQNAIYLEGKYWTVAAQGDPIIKAPLVPFKEAVSVVEKEVRSVL